MERLAYKDFDEGVLVQLEVAAAYGHGRTVDEGSYEYDGRTNKTWEMQVYVGDSRDVTYFKLTPTIWRAISPHVGKLGVGARFSVTKINRGTWEVTITESNTAPPATSQMATGTPTPRKGAPQVNPDLGHRYDKWSQACLPQEQMQGEAEWAADVASVMALKFGFTVADNAEQIQHMWTSLLIMAGNNGIPAEFGGTPAPAIAATRAEMLVLLGDGIMESNLRREDVAEYICDVFGLTTSADLPENELAKIVADLPSFTARASAWVSERAAA